MRTRLTTLIGVIGWLVYGLPMAAPVTEITAQLLVFQVSEAGAEPYISRLLMTPEYLRLDRGQQDSGFILLDRKARIIYSVDGEERTILVIEPPRAKRKLPDSIKLSASLTQDETPPEVGGVSPQHWRFFVNDRLCRDAVVAPGLLPQAGAAYGEYLDLLADQQLATLHAIPAELQDPCDQAIHVYAPLAVLDKGLPLRERHVQGWSQELLDFREAFSITAESFRLPADYRRVPLGEM